MRHGSRRRGTQFSAAPGPVDSHRGPWGSPTKHVMFRRTELSASLPAASMTGGKADPASCLHITYHYVQFNGQLWSGDRDPRGFSLSVK